MMEPLDCLDIYADAEFYDDEFAGREDEIPFFVEQARLAKGPVLEVACGTGRLTLPIAVAGIEITGLDVSPQMLKLAKLKAAAQQLPVTWLEQDCRNICSKKAFALVFSAANAMQHLLDFESVNAFLNSARNVLQPDGALILDVFNPNPAKLARTVTSRYHHKTIRDKAGNEIRVEAASEYCSASQILAFKLFYRRGHELLRTKHVRMRCFYPQELRALCHFNGFEIKTCYGNYDYAPFEKDSPKQILICRNRG
jgi:2-polyprenyl-3-methyl-5-hydroxy-6-metoxy-1,4-benzoquinol methylase